MTNDGYGCESSDLLLCWHSGTSGRLFGQRPAGRRVRRREMRADAADELPADLGTRKHGVDWPTFLGPDRNGKSPETGILTPWPADGLRIVWQSELGESYGIGSVSRGRYLQFDRLGIPGPTDMPACRDRRGTLGVRLSDVV